MRRIFIILGALCLIAQSSLSFDGKRKGFNLGLGIGYSPVSRISESEFRISSEDGSMVISFVAGYATGRELFVYEGQYFEVEHGLDAPRCCESVDVYEDSWRWYHYFGDEGNTIFSCAGAALTKIEGGYREYFKCRGLGIVVGGGLEFTRQIQIGLYIFTGYATGDGYRYGIRSLQLVTHIIAY